MKLTLSEEDVSVLSGGPKAGLRDCNCSIALQQREDHRPSSGIYRSQALLLDYIQEEILSHLEASLQDFSARVLSFPLKRGPLSGGHSRATVRENFRCSNRNLFLIPWMKNDTGTACMILPAEALLGSCARHATRTRRPLASAGSATGMRSRVSCGGHRHRLCRSRFLLCCLSDERAAQEICAWRGSDSPPLGDGTPQRHVVHEHAHFVLTARVYLLNAFASTSQETARQSTCADGADDARVEEVSNRRETIRTIREISASLADERGFSSAARSACVECSRTSYSTQRQT